MDGPRNETTASKTLPGKQRKFQSFFYSKVRSGQVRTTTLFPLGAIGISIISYLHPGLLLPFKGYIVPLLGLVMLGMGMTLRPEDFRNVLRTPKPVTLGVALQFILMPFMAWLIAESMGLPLELALGMVLVGSCPGGTASNIICYLAKGEVAVSITLTAVSTLLAVFLTPLLTWIYIGHKVPVPVPAMMLNIFTIILAPVTLGVFINYRFGDRVRLLKRIFPGVSVAAVILIIGIIIANTQTQLTMLAAPVLAAVCLHNLSGLAGGYCLAWLFGCDERIRRTLAIEVGMQNSGLAIALVEVTKFPLIAALPGALFSIWHNISGSILAACWGRGDD